MHVIRGVLSDETDACAGKEKQSNARVEANAECVAERDMRETHICSIKT